MVSIAPQFTQHSCRWTDWKVIYEIKHFIHQFEDDGTVYTIWGYDGPEVYLCNIWKETLPYSIADSGYTQEQNDLDKVDFETNFKAVSNKIISEPVASDGKPFVLPNIFPGDVILNFAGRADGGGIRYNGDMFEAEKVGAGDTYRSFSFQDGVFLTGGLVSWANGGYQCTATLDLYSSASTVEDPETPGTGDCNLVATGLGFNMIVPAAGDGSKNLVTFAPIPAEDDETSEKNGYWEYTDPWVGAGEISAGVPGASKFNLFDAAIKLSHFCDAHLLPESGKQELNIQNVKPKWILPQWYFYLTLHNANADKTLQMAWSLVIARRRSA
jgi:hypothetical protein